MKTSIPTLLTAALFAGLTATLSADTAIRHVNQGRAGHVATPQKYTPRTVQHGGGTTVALAMEKPGKPAVHMHTAGRAGFHYAYERKHGR